MSTPTPPQNHPSCSGCIHLQTTYSPEQPYGCRAFGFRSRAMPCRVVFDESGTICQLRQFRSPPQVNRLSNARPGR